MSDQPRNPAEAQADELDRLHARGWTGGDQQAQELTPEEREAIIAELRPPRRALTKRGEGAFEAGRLAVFEQRGAHEAEGKELPPYDEQRIFFRAGLLAARAPVPMERPDEARLKIALMEREWLLGAWAAACGIPQAEAEAEMLAWSKKWREDALAARLPEQPDEGITDVMVDALATLICGEAYVRHENREPPCAGCRGQARRYLTIALAARLPEQRDEGETCDECGREGVLEPTDHPEDGIPLCPTCAVSISFTEGKHEGERDPDRPARPTVLEEPEGRSR